MEREEGLDGKRGGDRRRGGRENRFVSKTNEKKSFKYIEKTQGGSKHLGEEGGETGNSTEGNHSGKQKQSKKTIGMELGREVEMAQIRLDTDTRDR